MSTETKLPLLLLISGACLAFVAVAGVTTLVTLSQKSARTPHIVSKGEAVLIEGAGALTGAVTIDEAELDAPSYVPTSQYVEEGADSNEVTLGFVDGEDAGPRGEPIDDAEVQEAVYANQNDLIQCYADALARDEDLQGRVDFHFRIAPDGHVAMVKVTRSELADHEAEECFVAQAKRWDFPETHRAQLLKFDTNFTFAY